MDNIEIANIFNEIADILEIKGANQFRVNAYRRAAQSLESLTSDIHDLYQAKQLKEVSGIGEGMAQHIKDLLTKGRVVEFEKLKKSIPAGILELLNIEGLGPKKVKFLSQKLKVKSIKDLEIILQRHRLLKFKGWGEKSEQNILRGIELYHRFSQRYLLGKIYLLAQKVLARLKTCAGVEQVEICGSMRRMKETIGDVDILATATSPQKVIDCFCALPEVQEVLAQGPTKANVILRHGPETDLRVVKKESFGAALHYFTGSKAHNIAVRKMAITKGLRINEYGVYKKIGKKLKYVGGKTEEEVFRAVGLPWIPPEIRENTGEIEVALKNQLPKLIEQKDIKGDLHLHSTWSDGSNSILEMAMAAKKIGYQYLAITDHASSIGIINPLNQTRLLKQIQEIKKINPKLHGIKILAGTEVDIEADGRLNLPDKILAQLDIVVAAIHTGFRQPKDVITKRILRAMQNKYVNIIAHPTGRLINEREAYEVDMSAIIQAAKKTNTILELNSLWNRLDLNDINCRAAKESGVRIAISTDSHNSEELTVIKFGVATARRGWLEKKDVVNTWPLARLLKIISR